MATRFHEKLLDACSILTFSPGIGPLRTELAPELHVHFYGNYALYYLVQQNEVVVVRVLHGARDAVAIATQGGFHE